MTTLTAPTTPSPFGRVLLAVPVVGHVIRDVKRENDSVFYLLVILLTAVVLAVQTWGLPALVLIALALVPVMFSVLIVLARP
jgi:hypothetical protein